MFSIARSRKASTVSDSQIYTNVIGIVEHFYYKEANLSQKQFSVGFGTSSMLGDMLVGSAPHKNLNADGQNTPNDPPPCAKHIPDKIPSRKNTFSYKCNIC